MLSIEQYASMKGRFWICESAVDLSETHKQAQDNQRKKVANKRKTRHLWGYFHAVVQR